ncbi:MAG: hypothetical protein LDL33_16135 [Desulfomonile sp.]|nr:hypothetical protein [Desulfomonile sp.]
MSANAFREDELVSRKVKVGNEWQTRIFPVVGGRLRLAHEENGSVKTEMVSWDGQYAIFKCAAITTKGEFVGYGTANSQRDARLAESLIELAETRSIARALRFAGYGLEYTGAEEVSHVPGNEADQERTGGKEMPRVVPDGKGNEKLAQRCTNYVTFPAENTEAQDCAPAASESKSQHCGIGRATTAQVRALHALTRRARYGQDDIDSMLQPLNASTFQDLTREAASQLITYLQQEVAA